MADNQTIYTSEMETFYAEVENLLRSHASSDYVVIAGNKVCGVFQDYGTALRAGYAEEASDNKFLVKQLGSVEEVHCLVSPLR